MVADLLLAATTVMPRLWWLLGALALGGVSGVAVAQEDPTARSPSFQLEHFEPQGDPVVSIVNVPSPEVRPHMSSSVGVVCHHTDQPIVLVPVGGTRLEALASQTRCEVIGSLSVFEVASLELSLPVVLAQDAPAPEVFNLEASDFNGVVAGDLRFIPKVQLFRPVGGFSAALATPLYFPTGDGTTFNGGGGLRMEPQLIAGWRRGAWQVATAVSHQLQNPMKLHNITLDDATRWRVGLRTPLGVEGLKAFAVAFGAISSGTSRDPGQLTATVEDDKGDPAEAMGGVEYLTEGGWMLRLGGGRAISKGIGAPTWRAMAAVDWVGEGGAFVPEPWTRGPHVSTRWRLLLRAPALTGVGPFALRRRAVQSPAAVYSVDSAQVGEQTDLTVTVEVGQAAVRVADQPEGVMVGLGVAVAAADDVELSVEVPSMFSEHEAVGGDALGDLTLRVKALAVDGAEHPFGAGLVIPVTLPTATADALSTERASLGTVGVGEIHLGALDVRGNLGVHIENDLDPKRPLGALAEIGAGTVWHIEPRWQLGGEVFGLHPINAWDDPRVYGGAVLGGHEPPSGLAWSAGVKATRSLDEVTQVDLLFRASWATSSAPPPPPPPPPPPVVVKPPPPPPPPVDEDGDGIGEADECPKAPEDHDGYKDEDGCPELDNDADGVLDAADRCPNTLGIRQWEGCDDINITVAFPFKSTAPPPESAPVFKEMVMVILSNPQVQGVVVEGHTDDRGELAFNQRLSEQRAEAVRKAMIDAGADPALITAVGYGEERPRVPIEGLEGPALEEARTQNRRVRFILRLEGGAQGEAGAP